MGGRPPIELTATEALLRLGLAVLVGMAIGLEREWREKAAGFRTITLVTAGSAMFVLAGFLVFPPEAQSRVAQGVVTGIGFLGAGTILRDRGQVVGLTTAAAVWAACALGIGAALGAYGLVGAGTLVVLVVLLVFPRLEVSGFAQDVRHYELVTAYDEGRLAAFTQLVRAAGLQMRRNAVERDAGEIVVAFEAVGSAEAHEGLTRELLADEGVRRVEVRS